MGLLVGLVRGGRWLGKLQSHLGALHLSCSAVWMRWIGSYVMYATPKCVFPTADQGDSCLEIKLWELV